VPDSVRAPSSAGGQPDGNSIVWNTDDERDYSDYEYSPPSPMANYPGPREPLARFMADLPDVGDFDKLALNKALRGLPVPDSGWPGTTRFLANLEFDILFCRPFFPEEKTTRACWLLAEEDAEGRTLTFIY